MQKWVPCWVISSSTSISDSSKILGKRSDMLLELLGVILIFIIVLVLCWLVTRFIASRQLKQKSMGNFEVIETHMIARDRYLQIVRIAGKYFAIAVSKDNINLISEIPEEDVVQPTKFEVSGKGFATVLNDMLKKTGLSKKNEIDSSIDSEEKEV